LARRKAGWVLEGDPIDVVFLPALTICRGKLLTAEGRGTEVHAGCFIRKRRIVLDCSLLENPRELDRILGHEIFHFAWPRLSNKARSAYEQLISAEWHACVPGELGWSAEWRKHALRGIHSPLQTKLWRAYLCESFCDTGAWRLNGGRHGEFTLPAAARRLRRSWWDEQFGSRSIPI
jgi:hypothetical protein